MSSAPHVRGSQTSWQTGGRRWGWGATHPVPRQSAKNVCLPHCSSPSTPAFVKVCGAVLSQRHIWKAEWIKFKTSRQRQAPSTPGRHSKAPDVGQVTWCRKYWFLWECEWTWWNQWFWSHHSDSSEHISSLTRFFQNLFTNNSAQYDWVKDPFSAAAPADFSSTEEDQFIEITASQLSVTLRLRLQLRHLMNSGLMWRGIIHS